MDCKQAQKLFVDYRDGTIQAQSRGDFESHLAGCPACRLELEAYNKTLEEVSGLIQLAPTDDFHSRVKKTIDRRSRGRFFGDESSYSLKFAIISFILILIVLFAYYFVAAGRDVKRIESNSDASGKVR